MEHFVKETKQQVPNFPEIEYVNFEFKLKAVQVSPDGAGRHLVKIKAIVNSIHDGRKIEIERGNITHVPPSEKEAFAALIYGLLLEGVTHEVRESFFFNGKHFRSPH